jgi:hypothetical protein
MRPADTIRLCTYEDDTGEYELLALLDELSLTYHVVERAADGRTRRLKAHLSSLAEARRWARTVRHER